MKTAIAFLVVLLLLVGSVAGSYALSLNVAHQSTERLCKTFEYFIGKPTAPLGTALWQREETQYRKLLEFERRLGC